jgi:protein TonB
VRTLICYIISVLLHGAALAAMACVSCPSSYQPPQFAVGQGGGGQGGDPAGQALALEASFSSRRTLETLVRLRIEAVPEPQRTALPPPASAFMPNRVAPEVHRRRPVLDDETLSILPTTTITPAKISRIAVADAAPSPLADEQAWPKRIVSELSPLEIVAGEVAPESTSPDPPPQTASQLGESSGSNGDRTAGQPTAAGSAPAIGSGAIGREFRGPAGDGRPGGPGGGRLDQIPSAAPRNPTPPYPPDALARGIEGRVLLRVWIRDDGTVEDVKIHQSSGDESLDQSALSTVRDRWRFVPARRNGVDVSCQALLPIRFRIHEGSRDASN